MNYELGDYDFDTFKETSEFTFEFTNSKSTREITDFLDNKIGRIRTNL